MKIIVSICFFLSLFHLSGQQTFGIQFPGEDREQLCNTYFTAFKNKPKETKFSIKREKNQLFFETNDKKWFLQLFKKSGDGLALDIVSKNRYVCDTLNENTQIRGLLLKPIYQDRLKKTLKPHGKDRFRVLLGNIPPALSNNELEYNILFLNNKNLCLYYVIYNLAAYPWDLLDMGIYLDSLTYDNKKIDEKGSFKYHSKTLKFVVPFEKNKSVYSKEDIKPLYDSLNLTDFNIKKIAIHAYASVEGSEAINLDLQKRRAASITTALQEYQKPHITSEITTSENWVEFFNVITNTKYNYLKPFSKPKIKKLLVGKLSSDLEPYLKKHRKAVITLDLDKKDFYKSKPIDTLIQLFNKAIKSDDLDKAIAIQNSLFTKMRNQESAPDILDQLTVPKQLKFLPILNKNAMYRTALAQENMLITYNELVALKKLDPTNAHILYNLTALKIYLCRYKAIPVDQNTLKSEIEALKKHGISNALIERMLVNYHIVNSEKLMRKRNYTDKDKSISFINKTYKNFQKTDYDYLSLAQFFSYYANTNDAIKLLEDKVQEIVVDQDLLFYYINLTLINKEQTKTDAYRTIMLNAYNLNPERFCKLFSAPKNGGVTFQLLEDPFLKNYYCENCQ